jgi:preprotein translocase subunit YajC
MVGNVEILAATASKASGGNLFLPIAVVAILGLMYFVMIRPQRNRQRQIQQVQNEIVPGMKVRTTAGMYATVVALEDGDVVLEVAPGVNARFMRRAIMDVIPPETGPDTAEQSDAEPEATDQSVNGSGPVDEKPSATGAAESGSTAD